MSTQRTKAAAQRAKRRADKRRKKAAKAAARATPPPPPHDGDHDDEPVMLRAGPKLREVLDGIDSEPLRAYRESIDREVERRAREGDLTPPPGFEVYSQRHEASAMTLWKVRGPDVPRLEAAMCYESEAGAVTGAWRLARGDDPIDLDDPMAVDLARELDERGLLDDLGGLLQ